jgi:hypothetical protein
MADKILLEKVQDLSDLELAVLLCLIAQEHCIIDTEPSALDDVVHELQLVSEILRLELLITTKFFQVASNVFSLSQSVVDCSESTSLDDFANAIFIDAHPLRSESPMRTRQDASLLPNTAIRSVSRSPNPDMFSEGKKMASVIIAKNLDEAPKPVQIQVLELIRTKRIFTHTSVQNAPKPFLIIAVVAGGEGPRLTRHLNDHMFISHFHDPDDGFPNLEDLENDGDSISSIVRRRAINDRIETASDPIFSAFVSHGDFSCTFTNLLK